VRDGASAGLSRSLSELRRALSEADLPEEAASRSILSEARDLTAEIEARVDEGRREADAARSGREDPFDRQHDEPDADEPGDRGDRGVTIDVADPDDDEEADAEADSEGLGDPAPSVDVDSELESIKRQLDDEGAKADDERASADDDPDATRDQTDSGENDDQTEAGDDGDAPDDEPSTGDDSSA
jgi:hypothetical protein